MRGSLLLINGHFWVFEHGKGNSLTQPFNPSTHFSLRTHTHTHSLSLNGDRQTHICSLIFNRTQPSTLTHFLLFVLILELKGMLGVCYLVMVWLTVVAGDSAVGLAMAVGMDVVCGSVCMEILLKFFGLWCVNVVMVVVGDLWVIVVHQWWWWWWLVPFIYLFIFDFAICRENLA